MAGATTTASCKVWFVFIGYLRNLNPTSLKMMTMGGMPVYCDGNSDPTGYLKNCP